MVESPPLWWFGEGANHENLTETPFFANPYGIREKSHFLLEPNE
jgi:hypothetical protein